MTRGATFKVTFSLAFPPHRVGKLLTCVWSHIARVQTVAWSHIESSSRRVQTHLTILKVKLNYHNLQWARRSSRARARGRTKTDIRVFVG